MEKLVKISKVFTLKAIRKNIVLTNTIPSDLQMFNKIKQKKRIPPHKQCHKVFAFITQVNVFTFRILLTTTRIIFSDRFEFLVIKSLIVCSIIVPHKSMEKPNTPFPNGGKAIVKRLFWFVISNALIIPFFRSS